MDLTQRSTGIATVARRRPSRILAYAIVALTIATAYIHLGLGGLLFTLNAAGYAALAAALVLVATVPHPLIERFAWAPRVGLAGYAATTIVAYLVMGPYFSLGWIAKAIEVAILGLLAVDLQRTYGSPSRLLQAALASVGLAARSRPEEVA
ncbi:MAG TPA: hypothetical protein VK736_03950 [Candidatus Binatia bacterium]|nr:hypothetical protein [Candidatus Binatia bacterium]